MDHAAYIFSPETRGKGPVLPRHRPNQQTNKENHSRPGYGPAHWTSARSEGGLADGFKGAPNFEKQFTFYATKMFMYFYHKNMKKKYFPWEHVHVSLSQKLNRDRLINKKGKLRIWYYAFWIPWHNFSIRPSISSCNHPSAVADCKILQRSRPWRPVIQIQLRHSARPRRIAWLVCFSVGFGDLKVASKHQDVSFTDPDVGHVDELTGIRRLRQSLVYGSTWTQWQEPTTSRPSLANPFPAW